MPLLIMKKKKRTKIRYVDVDASSGNFVSTLIGGPKEHDFSDVKLLRQLLSNEKARILYQIKHKSPKSIYQLSKLVKRDLKSVREDVHLLERFGFIEFNEEKVGKRFSIKPVLSTDRLQIFIDI